MGGSKKKKSKKKSKQEEVPRSTEDDGNIVDKRFQIAQTHPQFQKLHTKKNVKNDGDSDDDIQDYKTYDGDKGDDGTKEEKIDDRFKAVLTDSRFAIGGDIGVKEGGVDKYGRKQKKKKKKKKEDLGNGDNEGHDNEAKESQSNDEDSEEENEHDEDSDVDQNPESRIAYLTALSRGEIDVSSTEDESSDNEVGKDDSSDDDSSTGSDDSLYGKSGILDPSKETEEEVEITFDKSRFLAVCNMDWTNVRAVDLLAVLSSFSPPGSVKFVHVYPSDFGLERMEKDRVLGPVGVWKKKKKKENHDEDEDSEDSEDKDDELSEEEVKDKTSDNEVLEKANKDSNEKPDRDINEEDEDAQDFDDVDLEEQYDHFKESGNKIESDFDAEKLRAYEAAKMKYYFAVVEFNSFEAADVAYKELDGMEMGHSSASLDLRSIPESEVGNVIKGREYRDKASVLPSNYTPPDFVVSALQQTDVKCTWDEGDKERERMLTQYGVGNDAWNAMANGDDLRAYIASGK